MRVDRLSTEPVRRQVQREPVLPGNGAAGEPVPGRVMTVIVTYHPNLVRLRRLIEVLLPQVSGIHVIDNGSHAADIEGLLAEFPSAPVEVTRMGANLGLGRAQNAGIERVRAFRPEYVLLMDQDSEPECAMVATLREALEARPEAAAAGPAYQAHALGRRSGFVYVSGLRMRRQQCTSCEDVVEVDHLIASGSLIPVQALDRIGGLRDDLFIDYVDIEWGLRARARGMRVYGVCAAGMSHRLGDATLSILGRSIPQYSPQRIYYQVRNSILLLREPFVPLNWKLVNLRQVMLRCLAHIWRVRPVRPYVRMIGVAVAHGVRGRAGRLDAQPVGVVKEKETL